MVTGINSHLWPSGLAERIRDSRSSLLLFCRQASLLITPPLFKRTVGWAWTDAVVSKRLCVLVSQVWPGAATWFSASNRIAGIVSPTFGPGRRVRTEAWYWKWPLRTRESVEKESWFTPLSYSAAERQTRAHLQWRRELRLKLQAGISDFIRLTWTRDSISFLVSLVLCLTLQALRDDSLYDIFQKVVRQIP
jgi:hypothetical protein